jgi:hypothetical protein
VKVISLEVNTNRFENESKVIYLIDVTIVIRNKINTNKIIFDLYFQLVYQGNTE